MYTLLDIAKLDAGIAFPLIDETSQASPEVRLFPADTMPGTSMELTVRTDLPTVSFRNVNEGVAQSKAKWANKTFQTFILDHQISVDVALVNAAKNKGLLLEDHAAGVIEAAIRKIGSQIWYGTGNDAKGFPGMIAQHSTASTHNTDAGGSTAKTSVWLVRLGRETVNLLFGNDQTLRLQDTWDIETVLDGSNNPFKAYTNWMTGRVGLRLANKNSVVRIKNLGTDSGKGLTDDLLFDALEKFTEYGAEPTHIFMNGRSREQLRASRTATNPSGMPVPLPSEWEGIPIIRTANITNAES